MADSNHFTKPMTVALAVGITFIAVFVLVFGSEALFSEGQSDSITIGIDGIDGREYHVGDELDILVKIQGTTFDCAAPRASIVNTDTSQTLWDSGISLILCDPDRRAGDRVDITWHLGQYYTEDGGGLAMTNRGTTEKIVPTEAGIYELVISFAGQESTVQFTVFSNQHKPPPPSPPAAEFLPPKNFTDAGNEGQDKITVAVDIGGESRQSEVQSGMGSSLATNYLPVNVTQTIHLAAPTENMIIYPVFADWDGIVRANLGSSMVDKNGNHVDYDGVGLLSLHGVNAVCSDPYPIQLTTDILADDGIQYVNATESVSSSIPWGDIVDVSFNEAQSGTIQYTEGYGIVPSGYNDITDSTYRNNGAGNQDMAGKYHLSFTSFYPATVSLPEQAAMTSFLEAKCTITEDSPHVQMSEMPYIYLYDVWFMVDI